MKFTSSSIGLICFLVVGILFGSPTNSIAGANPCGLSPSDWCPALKDDPCGSHKDKSSCMADGKCEGMPYGGESVIACQFDSRGFASNCPTVGCMSACQSMKTELCKQYADRCVLNGDACEVKTRK
jgi:hypothetical protein